MPEFETYVARGGRDVSAAVAGAAARGRAAERGGYAITVRFMGGLTDSQRAAFKAAADRWSRVITGDLRGLEALLRLGP